MDGQPDELLRQLDAVDQQFPSNLKDRPYETPDLIWNGPFYGKNGPQVIRNPLTDSPTPMAPLSTPDHYLAALNTMVEAKANARANVLRGWDAQQASSNALAKAWGVDPSQVQGQGPKTAQGVIQGQVEGRKEAFGQQQEARRTNIEQQHVDLARQDFNTREADRQSIMQEKADFQKKRDAALSGLPAVQAHLNSLPAEQAYQEAPGALAGLAEVGSPLYEQTLNSILMRDQHEQLAKQRTAQATQEHLQRIGDAAKSLDEQFKPYFSELRKVAPVKNEEAVVPEPILDDKGRPAVNAKTGQPLTMDRKKQVPRYDNAFEERLASIASVINGVSSFDPSIADRFGEIEALRDMADKRVALNKINGAAMALEQRVREILGEQKAKLQSAPPNGE